MNNKKDLPLRIGVGIILLNHENKVFVGKRIDNPGNFWQMPQGGIDKNESYLEAAKRELKEETGVVTVKVIKDLKVNYLTIHVSAGLEALKASKKVSGKTKLIGVTTLTSLDNKSLKMIGYSKNVKKLVIHQAKLASKAKLDALVCSPHEVKYVKKVFKKEIITPGIRLNSNIFDQKRVMTPKEAFKSGSDWLVIGRPITKGNIKNNFKKLLEHLS